MAQKSSRAVSPVICRCDGVPPNIRPMLLRHPADRRSLAFILLAVAAVVAPVLAPIPPAAAIAWVPFAATISYAVCAINHNHIHAPIFRAPWLNAVVGVLITIATGHSATSIVRSHNLNHHVHAGGAEDWMSPAIAGEGPGFVRVLRFVLLAPVSLARGARAHRAPRLSPRLARRLRAERVALVSTVALGLGLAPGRFLLFVLPAWAIALALFVGVNFLQHDGCDPRSSVDHSRNFESPFTNWLFFNSGYHTAHHLHPSLHWTELPRRHREEVAPRIAPGLSTPTVLGHLFRSYLTRRGPAPVAAAGGARPDEP